MRERTDRALIDAVVEEIGRMGFQAHPIFGVEHTVIGVIGAETSEAVPHFESLEGVEKVVTILKPYKFVARAAREARSQVNVKGVCLGGSSVVVIAGPCAVESKEQILQTAETVKECGGKMLRGGSFKPRTSPHTFQGLGEKGLEFLAAARERTGLPVVTEVMDPRDVALVARYADMLQVGARNMQNFSLLSEVGRSGFPVLLKRGYSCTVEELLCAAEYIAREGNDQIVLCERGIRTFETATRNTFDVSCIPLVKKLSHLPVAADPSHATGHWDLVEPTALAAIAAGADGLLIEVHPEPEKAASDGPQSLTFKNYAALMKKAAKVAEAVGRDL
jgi:3-deoxy-7-phosphoheptulonate synthase